MHRDHFDEKRLMLLDRFAQYALVAAREAVCMSGRERLRRGCHRVQRRRTGRDGRRLRRSLPKNSPRVNPMMVPRVMSSGAASHIAMEFGVTGPVYSVSTACSSANHAIGQAFWMVRSGMCESALGRWLRVGVQLRLSEGLGGDAGRISGYVPAVSRDRKGLILGEGAGMLVLEDLDAAIARGARVYGEIVGFGMSSDAHHITQPARGRRGARDAGRACRMRASIGPITQRARHRDSCKRS